MWKYVHWCLKKPPWPVLMIEGECRLGFFLVDEQGGQLTAYLLMSKPVIFIPEVHPQLCVLSTETCAVQLHGVGPVVLSISSFGTKYTERWKRHDTRCNECAHYCHTRCCW